MRYFEDDSFEKIYPQIIQEISNDPEFIGTTRGNGYKEISHLSFRINNPLPEENVLISNAVRNFNVVFARKFFDWIMKGGKDISELTGVNPNAKNYMANGELPDNFSTAYGPRIIRQLPDVIKNLKSDTENRRSVIHILEEGDKIIIGRNTDLEYPCTHVLQFLVRNGALHCYALMRSNNMVLTLCYDVWNFTRLMVHIANELGVQVGTYNHYAVSAHFFEKEQDLVNKILDEYSK